MSSTGSVELWHARCWAAKDDPVELVDTVDAPTTIPRAPLRLPTRWLAGAAAGVTIAGVAIATFVLRVELPASLATIQAEAAETTSVRTNWTSREAAPAAPDPREQFPVPDVDGTPLDELYPSLLDWIHPVVGADGALPPQQTGRFGADRDGILRPECGQGHCGVDLGGPIGRPIVAVSDGIVVRVERSELGRDGRSGRYVRIEHSDGALTSYMHLDAIVSGLEVGDRVDGGQQIGTLGATAISKAAPHLHFALEVPKVPGTRGGDHASTRYVDPAPFLVRSAVHSFADRRHAEKPAF